MDRSPTHGVLDAAIGLVNRGRSRPAAGARAALIETTLELVFRPSRRLAVYGSLAPGRENHGVLEPIPGDWKEATIFGTLRPAGWGSELGYGALEWNPRGEPVPAWVLSSPALREAWSTLDDFEGPEYLRALVPFFRRDRLAGIANCYVIDGGG